MSRIIIIGLPALASSYTGENNATTSSSHSLSVAIGTAESTRLVVVAVSKAGVNANPITSATIGGVTATLGTNRAKEISSGGYYSIQYIWALVPTGTTATVAFTLTETSRVVVHAFRIIGHTSITVVDQSAYLSASTSSGDSTLSISTDIQTEGGGAAIGTLYAFHNVSTTCAITTGVSQDVDTTILTNYTHNISGHADTSANPGLTITATRNASGYGNQIWFLAAISFR
jgi:hypothetical protein